MEAAPRRTTDAARGCTSRLARAMPEQVLRIAEQATLLSGPSAGLLVIPTAWTGCLWARSPDSSATRWTSTAAPSPSTGIGQLRESAHKLTIIIFAASITIPFSYFGGGFDPVTSTQPVPPAVSYLVLTTIGSIIAGTLTEPFAAGVTVPLYTDQRIRRERMDIELARMAAE